MDQDFERRIVRTWEVFKTQSDAPWINELPEGAQFTIIKGVDDMYRFIPGRNVRGRLKLEFGLTDNTATLGAYHHYSHGRPLSGYLYHDFTAPIFRLIFTLGKLSDERSVINLTHLHSATTSHDTDDGDKTHIRTHGGSHGVDN